MRLSFTVFVLVLGIHYNQICLLKVIRAPVIDIEWLNFVKIKWDTCPCGTLRLLVEFEVLNTIEVDKCVTGGFFLLVKVHFK